MRDAMLHVTGKGSARTRVEDDILSAADGGSKDEQARWWYDEVGV